jgi:hypothetical protein
MQERIRVRPVQRRLQQSGFVATYRGAQLWQLAAPEGAAPGARKTRGRVAGGCGGNLAGGGASVSVTH